MEKNEDLQAALAELRSSGTDEAAAAAPASDDGAAAGPMADADPDPDRAEPGVGAAAGEAGADDDARSAESASATGGAGWSSFTPAWMRRGAAQLHEEGAEGPNPAAAESVDEEKERGDARAHTSTGDNPEPEAGARVDVAGRASGLAAMAAGALGLRGKGAAVRDTLGAVFGFKPTPRKHPGQEDGREAYAWVEIRDGDRIVYRNEVTGETSSEKPPEFDLRGRAAPVANTEATALVAVQAEEGVWDRLSASLRGTPAMQAILGVAHQVAESEVGQAARRAKASVSDAAEDVREKWETSQNPWVYNASAAYDSLFSENEWGHAIREIRRVDPSFTMDGFALEMRDELVPEIVSAFLRSDRDTLNARCSERAMAQLSAALRQREAEGLTVDPNILSINNVDVKAAQVREKGPSVLVFQAMVQQINCTRNRKGEIVEGKDDEIRAVYYAFAVHRVYNEVTTELEWRIDEMAIIGAVLYL